MKKGLLRAVAVVATLTFGTTFAQADDFAPPPWTRWQPTAGTNNSLSIYATWEFQQDTNPVGPDNEAEIEANPLTCELCSNEIAFPTLAQWQPGDLDGEWFFETQGQIDGQLTNVIDTLSIPEPNTLLLSGCLAAAFLGRRRYRHPV